MLVATADEGQVGALRRGLAPYDVEVQAAPEDLVRDSAAVRSALQRSSEDLWTKAIISEETRLFVMPESGRHDAEEASGAAGWGAGLTAKSIGPELERRPAVLRSRLVVYQLPAREQKLVRESRTPLAPGGLEEDSAELEVSVYEHAVEGHVDLSRRALRQRGDSCEDSAVWDDIFVQSATGLTLTEVEALGGTKVRPCCIAVSQWIIEKLHYSSRKSTNFIREGFAPFETTISFREQDSVGAFVARSPHLNNPVAARCGLRNAFIAVANHGAFFRSARTRREMNYWLPGLNGGLPLTAKRDPIHEITFAAHDLGHFLLPDLVFTGRLAGSRNLRRTYVLYRMMSEALSCVLADMLFVETLRQSGYEYDWTLRKIHPLYWATGVRPLDAETHEAFLDRLRVLLEANVDYCLKGDTTRFTELIRANGALDLEPDEKGRFTKSSALEGFKEKYMPFFVEDYRWTNRNFSDMEGRTCQHQAWWELVQPLAAAAGVSASSAGGRSEIGLETVEDFMAAVGVGGDDAISSDDLIQRVFERVFETRIRPVFAGDEEKRLHSENSRRTQAFVRYVMGQCIIFSRFPFVPESQEYAQRIVGLLCERLRVAGHEAVGEAEVAAVRELYSEYLGILAERSLITPDDVVNFEEICPLFETSFAFYDESKAFYQQLEEVQREILGG